MNGARERVLEAPRGDVLDGDVDSDLYARIQVGILHRLYRIMSLTLFLRPAVMALVLASPARAAEHMKRQVDGEEEQVVEKDTNGNFRYKPEV